MLPPSCQSRVKEGILEIELLNKVPTERLAYGGDVLGKLLIQTNAVDDSSYEVPIVVKN